MQNAIVMFRTKRKRILDLLLGIKRGISPLDLEFTPSDIIFAMKSKSHKDEAALARYLREIVRKAEF